MQQGVGSACSDGTTTAPPAGTHVEHERTVELHRTDEALRIEPDPGTHRELRVASGRPPAVDDHGPAGRGHPGRTQMGLL